MTYPYKIIKSGKYTKWIVYITSSGSVLTQHYFKGAMRSQNEFKNQNSIKSAELPKNVKEAAKWALYEAGSLIII